jgi:hypothetical protein
VQLENEVRSASVFVRNAEHCLGAVREVDGVLPVGGREEDHLLRGAGVTDRGHDGLGCGGPGCHVEIAGVWTIVRFVHEPKNYPGLRFPVRGDLGPGLGEDGGAGAVLADDAVPPAAVVVDVDAGGMCQRHFMEWYRSWISRIIREYSHAIGVRAGIEADLDNFVVLCKISSIEHVGLEVVVDKWLPRRRKAEDVEAVGVDEVLHLTRCHVW